MKLVKHDQMNKQYNRENKPIEFRHCLRYFSISFQSWLFSISMCPPSGPVMRDV